MKINEAISSRVFHFCPIQTLYAILKSDRFNMTKTGARNSDYRMSRFGKDEPYPYYFCVTRNQYAGNGYAQLRRTQNKGDWKYCMARIELDGDLLNATFKGGAVEAFINPNDSFVSKDANINAAQNSIPSGKSTSLVQKRFTRDVNGYKSLGLDYEPIFKGIDMRQLSEFEDRIVSNKPFIHHAIKYIKRIDILCTPSLNRVSNKEDILASIWFALNLLPGRVFIYDNEVAFNSGNIRRFNLKNEKFGDVTDEFKQKWASFANIGYNNKRLFPKEIKALADYASIIIFLYDKIEGNGIGMLNKIVGAMQMSEEYVGEFMARATKMWKKIDEANAGYFHNSIQQGVVDFITTIIPPQKQEYLSVLSSFKDFVLKEYQKKYGINKINFQACVNIIKKEEENEDDEEIQAERFINKVCLKKNEIIESISDEIPGLAKELGMPVKSVIQKIDKHFNEIMSMFVWSLFGEEERSGGDLSDIINYYNPDDFVTDGYLLERLRDYIYDFLS